MTLKKLIYSIRQQLAIDARVQLAPTHGYELLAAAYGFDSYATLRKGRVFIETGASPTLHLDHLRRRCAGLGMDPALVLPVIEAAVMAAMIMPVPVTALHKLLPDEVGPDKLSPLLLGELNAACSNGNRDAHEFLAHLYEAGSEEESSAYWHAQRQAGKVLTGVEAEWADIHARQVDYAAKRAFHVREAARLGAHWAILEAGPEDNAHRWYTIAAERGDVDAMEVLIADYDRKDPQRCWTWIYLARALGTDLLEDRYRAVGEDGEDYDDEAGGPLYAVGSPALQVAPLDPERDHAAQEAAQALLAAMPGAAASDGAASNAP